MPATLTASMPSSPNSNSNFSAPPTSGHESGGWDGRRQEKFNRLREYTRSIDNRTDCERNDPYKLFVARCRRFHGHRTKRGHSFHAKKLRWLWYQSAGKNGPFEDLWNAGNIERTRSRNDELAITVRCLAGGFSQRETEAVIKAWGEHNGIGYNFMSVLVYRATSWLRALEYTKAIRADHQKENDKKYWSKTANRILCVLDQFGEKGASPTEIAAKVERDVDTVKHRLTRLCKLGQVVKVKRGLYRLPEQEELSQKTPVPVESSGKYEDEHEAIANPEDQSSGCFQAVEEQSKSGTINADSDEAHDIFLKRLLQCKDMDEAEWKLRDRFRREAKDFAEMRSVGCPQPLHQQLAALRSAWEQSRLGNEP